jgi:signal transduction histidine kinase/DNA-binding response OmpR family regulator
MLVTKEDTADALWIGGSEGLIRVKPDELASVHAPVKPWLTYFDASASDTNARQLGDLHFGRHRLVIQAGSSQLDQRKDLWFQTRLIKGGDTVEWSAPSPRSSFEFINLTDGSYTFETRALNPAGLMSESVSFGFRVLPPWYRTPWAYGSYLLAAGLGFWGMAVWRESRIRRRNQQLEQIVRERTSELERANSAKDDFLAGISHEIRNPMNGVVGLASSIDTSRFDPETRRRIGYLRHCATHLSSMLEGILDFSRLQSDTVELDAQPFEVHELVESVVAITATESQQAGLPVEVAVSPAVPQRLVGDAARIRQVLINFVLNALKYAGKGTVCLTVWSRAIAPGKSEVTFAVSDEGPGVSSEEQTKLFNRFVRGTVAKERRVAGTGLGLSVCKLIADRMHGRVWVESEPGQGATFHFAAIFPIAPEIARTALLKDAIAPHALVVDDEAYNRDALTAMLEQLGFRVSAVPDGRSALAAATAGGVAVVFLDFDLPDISGVEVAQQLRANPTCPSDLLIIATTAYTTPAKRTEALSSGMNSFLTKPISLDKVRSALTSATLATRATSPLHAPGRESQPDPLASLRLLASRKAVPLTAELDLYLRELDMEAGELTAAVERRDAPVAARAAHRLTGRFAFVWAETEEQLARSIEAAVTNDDWDHVDVLLHELPPLLDGFRARLVTLVD